jgi:hypothetical protein
MTISDPQILIAVIGTAATVAGTAASVIGLISQSRAKKAVEVAQVAVAQAKATAVVIDGISIEVDGRLSQLLNVIADHGIPIPPKEARSDDTSTRA